MTAAAVLRAATPADLPIVGGLLEAEGLPTVGLAELLGGLVVATRDGVVVGAAGLEAAGPDRLLRSLVVAPRERGRGTGEALVARLLRDARDAGVRHLWLLTETAAGFFPRFGFRPAPRAGAPSALQALAEFAHACPATAVALARRVAPVRVLVLCTANSARSQMAEALLAHWGGDLVAVASAGSRPGLGVHPEAIAALGRRGIAWTDRSAKGMEAVAAERWDLVLTVCDAARDACPAWPGVPMAHWGLPDPAAAPLADRPQAFEETAEALATRVQSLLDLPLAILDPAGLAAAATAVHAASPPLTAG